MTRVYGGPAPLSADVARWRRLAEMALDWASGARNRAQLREARDSANRAAMLGGGGRGDICFRLLEEVSVVTDPRHAGEIPPDLVRLSHEVLNRCDGFEAVRKAERRA